MSKPFDSPKGGGSLIMFQPEGHTFVPHAGWRPSVRGLVVTKRSEHYGVLSLLGEQFLFSYWQFLFHESYEIPWLLEVWGGIFLHLTSVTLAEKVYTLILAVNWHTLLPLFTYCIQNTRVITVKDVTWKEDILRERITHFH